MLDSGILAYTTRLVIDSIKAHGNHLDYREIGSIINSLQILSADSSKEGSRDVAGIIQSARLLVGSVRSTAING